MANTDSVAGSHDKRRRERVRLFSPIVAEIEGTRVALVDISLVGARVEQPFALPIASEVALTLKFGTNEVVIPSTVIRCRLDRSLTRDAIAYTAGLDFAITEESLREELRAMIRAFVADDLDARNEYALDE